MYNRTDKWYKGIEVKKRDLERRLKDLGFWQVEGAKHDKWTDGVHTEPIPRHAEINEFTAKAILKRAKDAADNRETKG